MKKKVYKKAVVSVVAGTMLCSNIPMNVLAQPNDVFSLASPIDILSERQVELNIQFENEYAKVGEPLTVTASGGTDYTYSWYIDGKQISNNTNSYTPTESDLEKMITVKVASEDMSAEKSIYCSKLPVVYINTENEAPIVSKEDYVSGTMTIQGNDTFNTDTTTLYDGTIQIRGRGNSTWGMPKKPYKIKLDASTNLFGMGKNKHWVLLANYSDTSLMRNTLAYNLSGEMGMPQMETTWVDVILNGKYVGNYQFCEQIKINKKRVNIFDWESFAEDAAAAIAEAESFSEDDTGNLEDLMAENMQWITSKTVSFNGTDYPVDQYIEIPDITGGYLMELDEYYDEYSKFRTDNDQPIMFKSPEFVATNSDMMDYMQEYIQAFENAVQSQDYSAEYNGTQMHYSELFDFDSLVDYWLINEIFYNEEINKKSTYMYKDIDGLVYMGPIWDMDYSSGGEGDTYVTNGWATVDFNRNAQRNMWYKSLIKDPYFVLKAQERYWEIRDTLLEDIIKDNGSIDTSYELLKESGKANSYLWPYKNQDLTAGVNVLKNWLITHINWLDTQFETKDSILESLGVYADNTIQLSLTNSKGDALPQDTISVYAKADVAVEEGTDVTLNITANNSSASSAEVYVNGYLCSTASFTSGTAGCTITSEDLSAAVGEKDIIEVRVLDALQNTIASNYMSALKTERTVITTPQELPVENMSATAGNYQSSDSPNLVLDGDPSTMWHTLYAGSDRSEHYITVDLGETYDVTGILATPRSDAGNGTITSYELQASMDGTTFYTVARGNWERTAGQKAGNIGVPVTARYIRLVSVESYSDNNKQFTSLAELRVVGNHPQDIADRLEALDLTFEDVIEQGNYTNSSYAAYEAARTALAQTAMNAESSQAQIDAAVLAYQQAVAGLQETANKTALTQAISQANNIDRTLYTDASLANLDEKLSAAQTVAGNEDATQAQVDAAASALLDALEALEEKPAPVVDKTALAEKITELEALSSNDYTATSYQNLRNAIADAKTVLNDENATQAQVNAAVSALNIVFDALVNTTALTQAINEADDIDRTLYTDASLANLDEKLTAAQTVADNEDATQAEVDAAASALLDALEALEEKTAPVVDKTALAEKIEEAEDIDTSLYKEETVNKLLAAIENAKAVLNDEAATQEQVDAAVTSLTEAISGLTEKEPDKDPDKEHILDPGNMGAEAGNTSPESNPGNVLDGDDSTIWETTADDRDLHYLLIDLKDVFDISEIRVTPRQDSKDGAILKYEIYTSIDGENFTLVAKGNWDAPGSRTFARAAKAAQSSGSTENSAVIAAAIPARYVKLVSVESYSETEGKAYSALAELNIIGTEHTNLADKTQAVSCSLDDEIAKGNYTDVSYARYKTAFAAVKAILADADATQEEIDSVVAEYRAAKSALTLNTPADPTDPTPTDPTPTDPTPTDPTPTDPTPTDPTPTNPTPTDPTPTNPTPSNPTQGNSQTNQNTSTGTDTSSGAVKTGDAANIWENITLLFASLGGFCTILLRKLRKDSKE